MRISIMREELSRDTGSWSANSTMPLPNAWQIHGTVTGMREVHASPKSKGSGDKERCYW